MNAAIGCIHLRKSEGIHLRKSEGDQALLNLE